MVMYSQAVATLHRISIFSGMRPADLRHLAAIARIHRVPKGVLVFKKKMAGNHLFVVIKGRIKIYSELEAGGRRKTFAFLEPGDFFGEMTLLDKKGRSLSAQAMADTELLTISRREFQNLIVQEPTFTLSVMKTLIGRLRQANEEIEALTFRSLYGRVCRKIMELAAKDAKDKKLNGRVLTINVTHAELADMAGTARELVTKVMSSLRRMRVVVCQDRTIKILSNSKLKELAQVE
ncbi:MAG: Crp/Fnr family transcriptional regulator [Elusimicrobia bacterium]|nr:Crp/Fnr family transcriptional regulator [Elusimicrobiota bacterium]